MFFLGVDQEPKEGDDKVRATRKGGGLSSEAKNRLAAIELERKCIRMLSRWVPASVFASMPV